MTPVIFFFKETLTIPKIKDLVNTTDDKYENMYKIISNAKSVASIDTIKGEKDSSTTVHSFLPNPNQESAKESVNIESMKNELRSFLKKNMQVPQSYGSSSQYMTY